MPPRFTPLLIAVTSALLGSSSGASAQALLFSEVSQAAGLDRVHSDPGYLMGSGGAFFDKDEDGDLDVLLTGSDGSPWLFENTAGTFQDVTAGSGFVPGSISDHQMAVTCADVENDGDTDVFLSAWGSSRLFINTLGAAALTPFKDATAASGIDLDAFSTGAAFGDYDNDGFLDLYVGNYIRKLQFPLHKPFGNRLFHNLGDGTFEDVTAQTGVAGRGSTLAVTFTDVDVDGDLDIWVGNDFGEWIQPNELFVNGGPAPGPGAWKFDDRALATGTDQAIYCMGITVGDIDHDLDLDAYVTNLGRNVLLRNDGSKFVDFTTEAGVEVARDPSQPQLMATSWGCGFFDFDDDTWVDLYVSNGHIPAAGFIANGQTTPNRVFRNRGTGDGTFDDVSAAAGVENTFLGRGAAFGDFDQDGDVDILQTNVSDKTALLYRNDAPNTNHSLRVLPLGRRVARTAIGTRVTARFPGFAFVQESNPNMSFESSSDPAVHIGAGTHATIPHLGLNWLSGVSQDLYGVETGGTLALLEPLLTLDGDVDGPATGKVAQGWAGEVALTNHDVNARRATVSVRFLCGAFESAGPSWTADAAPGVVVRVPLSLTFPDPGPNGGPTMSVVVRVEDDDGGRDEARADVTLLP